MRKMKEKLVKNHYKGIDRKLKITGIVASCILIGAVCTFVPLTAHLEYVKYQTEAEIKNQDGDKTADMPTKQGQIIKVVLDED